MDKKTYNKQWEAKFGKQKRIAQRLEVLMYYSNRLLECACCKEKQFEFLCIDHIEKIGSKVRKLKSEYSGTSLYSFLRSHNFPKGYQVLCHNCNLAKGFYGICPHNK